jgi:hypothetical protein
VSADLATVLSPVIRAVERGELKFRRNSPRSKLSPNVWRCDP